MQKLILACPDLGIEIPKDIKKVSVRVLNAVTLTPSLAEDILVLWSSRTIRDALSFHKALQLPGGLSGVTYYMQNAKRFADEDYEPVADDVIRAKLRTTGVTEVCLQIGNQEYNMIDIGGQRSERRKWLHCFESVHIIIYLVAINEYDMVLEEDEETNRLEEAFKLFQLLTGTQWLRQIPCILFLNKCDLFREEIVTRPLEDHFPEYNQFVKQNCKEKPTTPDEHYQSGIEFMKHMFWSNFHGSNLYAFDTCAIDKDHCEKVFKVIRREIIEKALYLSGL
jgi:guanine nucleotide-binding protein subunit alpha